MNCNTKPQSLLLSPTSILVDMIRRRDWSLVRFRALSHPTDVNYRTSNLSTSLHHACLYRAPLDVIQLLISLNPDHVLSQDSQGWTPLHVAILYAASTEVCLLLVHRGGKAWGQRPSRYMGSALHMACRHGASLIIIKVLLQYCPSLASEANESGTLPANLIWFEFRKRTHETSLENLIAQGGEAVQELMEKMTCIVGNDDERHLLHQVMERHSDLQGLVQLLCRVNPRALKLRNDEGNLPLHIAAASSHDAKSMKLVLDAFPEAASIPDAHGRLPLLVGLQRGRTWRRGISFLVQASPKSLSKRNISTLLYPTQEAAVVEDDEESIERVDTIFELLSAWPPLCKKQ